MLHRVLAVAIAAILAGCSGQASETKREGTKASAASKPEATEEGGKIVAKIADTAKTAKASIQKEVVVKPPVTTDYFLMTEAFQASGFRVEALRKKVEEKQTQGAAYVKLVSFNGLPEEASIYDDMGNHISLVSYLWDKQFTVWGAVEKSSSDRMLGMYLFCPIEGTIYVHDLSTFRVHAPFTRKISSNESSVTVELLDGHDLKNELTPWPKCEDVADAQVKAGAYQNPFGVHKEVYSFDSEGNITSLAFYDLKGGLVEDVHGVARKELTWAGGRLAEEAWFAQDGLVARYMSTFDQQGLVVGKAVVDADRKPALDYNGYSSYEYARDKRGRVVKEVRKDLAGNPVRTIEVSYGRFNQIETQKEFDGQGALVTTYVSEFNKKGARTSFTIYEGDSKDGKLLADPNGVALYRFDYTDKGKLLKETRHGSTRIVDAQGKEDFQLANALDGWAVIENTYDENAKLKTTRYAKVDAAGNQALEQFYDEEGRLTHRVERVFDAGKQINAIKTTYKDGVAEKKFFLDAADNVTAVATLQYNSDGLLQETAWFQKDETSPAAGPEGYHKMVRTYEEDQKVKSDAYFDILGAKLKTTVYEYAQDGSFKGMKNYDAAGKEI